MDFLRSAIVILILLFLAGIAIGHIVKPEYFIKRSGVRKGGEMLTDLNRLGFQFFGLALLVGILCVTYDVFVKQHVFKVAHFRESRNVPAIVNELREQHPIPFH